MDQLPDDYFVTTHQFTKKVYRDQYPGIDPSSPALSQAGKIIIITGASRGLGRLAHAPAFAKAGAKGIVLAARNIKQLRETEDAIHQINPSTKVFAVAVDISDESSVVSMFEAIMNTFGTADVLINNAGVIGSDGSLIGTTNSKNWWRDFEINVKGTFLVTEAFLRLVGTSKPAAIITLTSLMGRVVSPGFSSYSLSKLISMQFSTFLAAEYPNLVATAVDPGGVRTDMMPESFVRFALDTPELVGGAVVWAASPAAKFMNGRYFCVQWSVDELVERQKEVLEEDKLKVVIAGKFGADQFQ